MQAYHSLTDAGLWWAVAGLSIVASLAVALAVNAALVGRARRAALARLVTEPRARARRANVAETLLLSESAGGWWGRGAAWIEERVPEALLPPETTIRLARAGFVDGAAPVLFLVGRAVAALVVPVLVVALTGDLLGGALLPAALGAIMGFALPPVLVDRLAVGRQARLRRALPDALDLLVVCAEAGLSLDSAMQRVARDLVAAHPELGAELAGVNRRLNAGIPREEALRGLWSRTGVDELRTLATALVQAERLGSSVGRVLRVLADSLRTRRRQQAEARAAEAGVKMIFPLVLFLLPAFFVIVLGPAVLSFLNVLGKG